jgi:hypothetical protein
MDYIMINRNGKAEVTGTSPDNMVKRLFKTSNAFLMAESEGVPITVIRRDGSVIGSVCIYKK